MNLRRGLLPLAAVLAALIATSCSAVDSILGTGDQSAVTVSTKSITLAGLSSEKKVTVTAKDKTGSTDTWTVDVDDTAVATVKKLSSSFTVKAVAVGTTFITVTATTSGKTAQIDVEVTGDATISVPTGFSALSTTANSISLGWTAPATAATYDIQRSTAPTGPWLAVASGIFGTTTTDSLSLLPSATYYYEIMAKTSSGVSSGWSAAISGTTTALVIATASPGTPTGLSATAPTSTGMTIAWTPAGASADYFEVRASKDAGASWTTIGPNVISSPWTASGLLSSKSYQFSVRATNTKGSSAWSGNASGTTMTATTTVTAPTAMPSAYQGAVTANSIQLKWFPVDQATSYDIQYKRQIDAIWITCSSGFVGLDFTQYNLTAATTYEFQVRGKNTSGFGPYNSPSVVITTTTATSGGTAPAAPMLMVGNITSSSIQIKWSTTTAFATDLYFGVDTGTATVYSSTPQTVYSPATDTTFFNLNAGVTYKFKAVAWSSSGLRSTDSTLSATTSSAQQNLPPPTVTGISVYSMVAGQTNLYWNYSPGADYYEVYRQWSGDTYGYWQYVTSTSYNYCTDYSALIGGSTYTYKIVSLSNLYGSNPAGSTYVYTAPNTGTGLTPPAVTGNGSDNSSYIAFGWNYASNVDHYNIDVSTNGGPYMYVTSYFYGSSYWYNMTLTPSTTYTFRVTAYDVNYNSQMSIYSYTTPAATTTTVPVTVHVN